MDIFKEKFNNEPEIKYATNNDVSNILKLQQENLSENLSEEDMKKEGFVTFVASSEILEEIIKENSSIVAKSGDKLVGYLISFSLQLGQEIPFFEKMISEAKKLSYKEKPLTEYSFCILGQIAIDKDWRNKGIVEKLNNEINISLASKYDLGLAEIAGDNTKSLHVNIDKLGFEDIGHYNMDSKKWIIVVKNFRS